MDALIIDEDHRTAAGAEAILKKGREIDVRGVTSAAEATAILDAGKVPNVIVVALASVRASLDVCIHARKVAPGAMRVVVLTRPDETMMLQAADVAHQVMTRPVTPFAIARAVETMEAVSTLVDNAALSTVLSGLGRLPSAPKLWLELCRLMDDESTPIKKVVDCVMRDPALSTALLKLVNSTFYSRGRTVTDIEQAITWVGFNHLRHLALQVSAFEQFRMVASQDAPLLEHLQRDSVVIAELSRVLIDDFAARGSAYAAGLLVDIGQIALLSGGFAEKARAIHTTAKTESRPIHLVEKEVLGTTHAEIGAFLLGLWGLPAEVVHTVAGHHSDTPVIDVSGAREVFAAANLVGGRPYEEVLALVPSIASKKEKIEDMIGAIAA